MSPDAGAIARSTAAKLINTPDNFHDQTQMNHIATFRRTQHLTDSTAKVCFAAKRTSHRGQPQINADRRRFSDFRSAFFSVHLRPFLAFLFLFVRIIRGLSS